MERTTSISPRLERVSSLRQQRDRSPERDRHHVRFEEANSAPNVADTITSEFENKEIHFSGSNPMKNDNNSKAQHSLKISREMSDSEGEKRKTSRSNSENSEENATAVLTAENLQNRQLPKRLDSNIFKATANTPPQATFTDEAKPQNEGNNNSDSDKDDNDKSEENKQQEYAMDEAEVNSDDFNEKLASLDENTRKYYHFFHLLDGVQSGCSVKTKKGVAGEFPAQDSFPMFKSAKYWIAIYWGVTLPMDAWAICFYTDHWTAHHGPKSALRTLPLSEISEVYLEPKTSAFFRIYRGKEVTQCTPTATTLASALWADAIFAVLQLHNGHDIKTIKDYFQAYQSFVHANRKQNNNDATINNNNTNTPRSKRQSIFGKMKEIFSSSSGDNHQQHPSSYGPSGGEGSNSSGNEGGVFSSEGEQTSPSRLQTPPLQRSKSSRAIRRWTTAVGGAFLNRSKSADEGLLSAAATHDHSADNDTFNNNNTKTSNNNKKSTAQHTTSVFFSPGSPTRRTSATSTILRRDSRGYVNPSSSQGFLTQSVIDFHRPESASSLRNRGSSFSEDSKTYHSGDDNEGEVDGEEIRSRYTESMRSSKLSMNSSYTEENDIYNSNSDTNREETLQDKPVKSILVHSSEENKSKEQKDKEEKEKEEELNNQKLQTIPEPRSIHDRMRHVTKTTIQYAYSSSDEQLHYKKKKPAHLREFHSSNSNNSNNNPGYFSDSHQIRHQVLSHHHAQSTTNRYASNSNNDNIPIDLAKAHSQLDTNSNTNNSNPPVVQEYVPPRPPAAELGQFTVLDLIFAQNMATLTQQQQRQKQHEQELSMKKKLMQHKNNNGIYSNNNMRSQGNQDTNKGEKQQYVTQETSSSPSRSRGNVSPIKQLSTKQHNEYGYSGVSGAVSQEKNNRDALLAEFLGGDLSTSFSLFSKKKAQQQQQQQQQQTVKQVSPKVDVKRQKGYLARALSSNNSNINHNKYFNNNVTNSNPVSSMFRYGKDRANSATTDDEDAAQRELQRQKYFAAMNNTDNNNDDKNKFNSPIVTSKRRKQPPKIIAVNEDNLLATNNDMSNVNDKPLELNDLLAEESKDNNMNANTNSDNNSNNDTNTNTKLQRDAINLSNVADQDANSPTAPEHKLFKVFHPNSSSEHSPASITPFAYTPSALQVPGVSSPLMEIDSQGIEGMLTHLEAIHLQYSSQRPVHEKISFLNDNHNNSNIATNAVAEQSQELSPSTERRSPRMGRHHSTGSMNMPLVSSPPTTTEAGTGTNSTKSPRNQLYQHTMMLQRKTPNSPRSPTTMKIPVPFSTTIQATLAGYPVTLTLLTKSELRQKLLNRPNLLPMRPGLMLSPVKQRPIVVDNNYESSNHTTNHSARSARSKYVRQQQQEREALEVTAMTMMAIAAELLEGDCYLSIQRVSNTLYTSDVQGMPSLVKPVLSVTKSQTESLLEDIVEEYVYIPLTRMMTLEVDESRSGLFRFLLSKLLPTNVINSSNKKGLDACLYVRSFDLLPSESLFLSLFGSVIGVSAALVSTGQTSVPASPSSPISIVGNVHPGHSNSNVHHAFEEAGGSAVGKRYNANRVPQVKDPKHKVASSSFSSHTNGMVVPTTPQLPSGTSFATLSFGRGGSSSSVNEQEYVSCVMKANSPEILPAFLQTMMYLRQTVTV